MLVLHTLLKNSLKRFTDDDTRQVNGGFKLSFEGKCLSVPPVASGALVASIMHTALECAESVMTDGQWRSRPRVTFTWL